jgi:AcrR family transcriptional regulator
MATRLRRNSVQKKNILDGARTLFWVKGYDKTSMKDIAHACGFEPSNVYNYYSSKEHLLYEVLNEGLERQISLIQDLENDSVNSPVKRIELLVKRNIEHVLGFRRSSGLLFDVGLRDLSPAHRKEIIKLRDRYEQIMRKIIRDGMDSGDFENTDEKLAGFAITSIIVRTRIWFSSKGNLTADEISDFIFRFILGGLGSRKPYDSNPAPGIKGQGFH